MFEQYLGSGRLAVLERWLPNTATILDRFHCIQCMSSTYVPRLLWIHAYRLQ